MNAAGAPASESVHPVQWFVLALVLSLGVGVVVTHWWTNGRLEQTEPLFVGFPTLVAAALVMARSETTLKGLLFQGSTVAIIAIGIVLADGYFWLLAVPFAFFYFSLVCEPEPASPSVAREAEGQAR
jgi:predicted exporter